MCSAFVSRGVRHSADRSEPLMRRGIMDLVRLCPGISKAGRWTS